MAARYRQISGDSDRCAAWTPTAACEASKAVDLVCEEARRAALTESVFRWRSRHGVARVKTYGEVFEEYEWHPESKCADASGEPAGKQTIGLLQRRHVSVGQIMYIGRESNQLEEVEAGTVHDAAGVFGIRGSTARGVVPRRQRAFAQRVGARKRQAAAATHRCPLGSETPAPATSRTYRSRRAAARSAVRELLQMDSKANSASAAPHGRSRAPRLARSALPASVRVVPPAP
jgi:hypothetical protein